MRTDRSPGNDCSRWRELARALHGGGAAQPDLQLREARAGDRYLLCTDGLHQVVAAEKVRAVLGERADPEAAVARFVDLANEAGGPDNIACVVVDVELGR